MTQTSQPVPASELKPCPFCGGKPHTKRLITGVCVACEFCGAHSAAIHNYQNDAIAAWNRRALSQQAAADPAGEVVMYANYSTAVHWLPVMPPSGTKLYAGAPPAQAQAQAQAPVQLKFMDEIDAAKAGEEFLDRIQVAGRFNRIDFVDDGRAQAPRLKWAALFDNLDNLRAAYLLTRDMKNWTQLTMIDAAPVQPVQQEAQEPASTVQPVAWRIDAINPTPGYPLATVHIDVVRSARSDLHIVTPLAPVAPQPQAAQPYGFDDFFRDAKRLNVDLKKAIPQLQEAQTEREDAQLMRLTKNSIEWSDTIGEESWYSAAEIRSWHPAISKADAEFIAAMTPVAAFGLINRAALPRPSEAEIRARALEEAQEAAGYSGLLPQNEIERAYMCGREEAAEDIAALSHHPAQAAKPKQWKSGNEYAPFHPQASHVSPAYRDGWNDCYEAAQADGRKGSETA